MHIVKNNYIIFVILLILLSMSIVGCSDEKVNNEEVLHKKSKLEEEIYSWKVQPTIEAESILVLDGSKANFADKEQCDLAIIKKNNKYGIIDYNGQILANCSYKDYLLCNCGMTYVIDQDYNYITVDNQNHLIRSAHIEHGMRNPGGDEILSGYDKSILLNNDIYAVEKDNKWGYCDKNGKKILSCNFLANDSAENDGVPGFSGNIVAVKNNRGSGFYNINGNCVIECGEFEETRSVQKGLAWVKKNGKWGIIEIQQFANEEGLKYMHLQTSYTDSILYQDFVEKKRYPDQIDVSNFKDLGKCVFVCKYKDKLTFMEAYKCSVANDIREICFWQITDKNWVNYEMLEEDYKIRMVASSNSFFDDDNQERLFFDLYHYGGAQDGNSAQEIVREYFNDSGLLNLKKEFSNDGLGGGSNDLSLLPISEIDWNSLTLIEDGKKNFYTFELKNKYSYSIKDKVIEIDFDRYYIDRDY